MSSQVGSLGLARLFGAESKYAREPLGFLSGVAIVLIWAGWYVISRWGVLGGMAPADIVFVRYASGTLLTLPMFWWWRGRKIPWRILPVLVLTYGFPYALAVFTGLRSSPAANAGVILNGLLPIVNAILAWLFFRQSVGKGKWIAICMLASSNFLMLYAGLRADSVSADWLWIVAATLLLGLFMTMVRKWHVDMVILIPVMSLGNFALFLPFWLAFESNLPQANAGEVLVQVLFQGVIAQVLVIWLVAFTVRRIGSVSTSVLYGFVPVATALLGWWVLGEGLGLLETLAILGCTAGIIAYARSP